MGKERRGDPLSAITLMNKEAWHRPNLVRILTFETGRSVKLEVIASLIK
jgi:hypothetical protein